MHQLVSFFRREQGFLDEDDGFVIGDGFGHYFLADSRASASFVFVLYEYPQVEH